MHAITLLTLAFLHIRAKWIFRKKSGEIGRDLTRDSIVLTILDWLWNALGPSGRGTDQSSFCSASDVDIAQAEEGAAGPRSRRFRHNKDILHGLLSQDDDDHEQLIREWNALADEDFVLSYSYVRDKIESPIREEAPTVPKRSVSRRRGRSPPAGRTSIEELPRLSIESGLRQDLNSRLH